MKTLDEVIREIERSIETDADSESEWHFLAIDSLRYLKEYQKILPLVPSLINTALAVQKKGKTIG